jgi:hypothetical protein
MKKHMIGSLLILMGIFFTSCSVDNAGVTIADTGKIAGIVRVDEQTNSKSETGRSETDSFVVYLEIFEEEHWIILDSMVTEREFVFENLETAKYRAKARSGFEMVAVGEEVNYTKNDVIVDYQLLLESAILLSIARDHQVNGESIQNVSVQMGLGLALNNEENFQIVFNPFDDVVLEIMTAEGIIEISIDDLNVNEQEEELSQSSSFLSSSSFSQSNGDFLIWNGEMGTTISTGNEWYGYVDAFNSADDALVCGNEVYNVHNGGQVDLSACANGISISVRFNPGVGEEEFSSSGVGFVLSNGGVNSVTTGYSGICVDWAVTDTATVRMIVLTGEVQDYAWYGYDLHSLGGGESVSIPWSSFDKDDWGNPYVPFHPESIYEIRFEFRNWEQLNTNAVDFSLYDIRLASDERGCGI